MLALGAFTMSAAFTKYQWSDRLAYFVLSRVGTRPVVVTIAVMFLGMIVTENGLLIWGARMYFNEAAS
jgi:di/tricarboxylate transporter